MQAGQVVVNCILQNVEVFLCIVDRRAHRVGDDGEHGDGFVIDGFDAVHQHDTFNGIAVLPVEYLAMLT